MEEQWIKESKDSEPRKIRPDDLLPPPQIKDFVLVDWLIFGMGVLADEELHLDTRKKLNKEKVTLLLENKLFSNKLQAIRESIGAIDLDPFSDIRETFVEVKDDEEVLISESVFLSENPKAKTVLKKEIGNIREQYGLSPNFNDWLQYFILYKKTPPWTPEYNWDLLLQVVQNQSEGTRVPLNSQEKAYLRKRLRQVLGLGIGRPPKEYEKLFTAFNKLLQESKNSQHISRTLLPMIEILKLKDEEVEYPDQDGVYRPQKRTYQDLAIDITEGEEMSEKEEKKLAQNLRKRKQRLHDRISNKKHKK